jgi:hypothetical protein
MSLQVIANIQEYNRPVIIYIDGGYLYRGLLPFIEQIRHYNFTHPVAIICLIDTNSENIDASLKVASRSEYIHIS